MSETVNAANIIQPGDATRPAGEIPFIHLPERNAVFRDRASRLRTLAEGHAMKDFLLLMARVCDAQQSALDAFPSVPLPQESHLRLCSHHGMPPLSVQSWPRASAWQDATRKIVARVIDNANPTCREALARVQRMGSDALEASADAILSGVYRALDLATAPFVAAGLQVYWSHMVSSLGAHAFRRGDIANLCPACASPPVASVVRIGGVEQGVRYLNCSLCDTQWHMVRVKCSNCDSTKGISYYSIAEASGAVRAEFCDECGTYLKIAYMEKDPYLDPVADDLATLALDLLMDDSGRSRSGPNLFMMTAVDSAV